MLTKGQTIWLSKTPQLDIHLNKMVYLIMTNRPMLSQHKQNKQYCSNFCECPEKICKIMHYFYGSLQQSCRIRYKHIKYRLNPRHIFLFSGINVATDRMREKILAGELIDLSRTIWRSKTENLGWWHLTEMNPSTWVYIREEFVLMPDA